MRAHQLNADGMIVNTIVVESINAMPNLIDASAGGTIGDYVMGGIVQPRPPGSSLPPRPPRVVSKRQAWLALYDAGKIPALEAAFDAIADPVQRVRARGEWTAATDIVIDSPLTVYMAGMLEMSEAELEELFRLASYL